MSRLRIACWLVLAALAAPAGAQQKPSSWPGDCKKDAARLCGPDHISLCLIDHEAELSPGCQKMVQGWSHKTAQSPHAWLGPCSSDAEKLCAGQKSISRCLVDRENDLDPGCRKMVAGWEKKAEAPSQPKRTDRTWLSVCSADAERVCPGKHSISLCMAEHSGELSPDCRKFMEGSKKSEKPAKK